LRELYRARSDAQAYADAHDDNREGLVARLHGLRDPDQFLKTRFAKGCHAYRRGEKAEEWFIYKLDDLGTPILRTPTLSDEHARAMDKGCHRFDLVAERILDGYTPEQNVHL